MKENEQMLKDLAALVNRLREGFSDGQSVLVVSARINLDEMEALEQSLRSLADENRALLRERDALRSALEDARDGLEYYGEYASKYGDTGYPTDELAAINAVLAGPKP